MILDANITNTTYCSLDLMYSNDVGLTIKGVVFEMGDNIPCRVRLFHKSSGRLIWDVVTDEHGNYVFPRLIKAKYCIVAHHPVSKFNAVIQDNVVPK